METRNDLFIKDLKELMRHKKIISKNVMKLAKLKYNILIHKAPLNIKETY